MENTGDDRGALTAAGVSCGSCDTELSPNSKFCNECGEPVAQLSRSAEYKQVTVLFADVVHSMDIAAAVGAERLREIMTDLVNRAAVVVQRYGGTVGSFTGDGVMAVFGAPIALEDHAVRACMAALDIQAETAWLAVEVKERDGIELQLRVGLNSGQVIAGDIGSGAFGYTAVGEQVGMAQRMESVAPPGGVMLSESTARLVENSAVLGEPQLVRIKGRDSLVAVRQLLGTMSERGLAGRDRSRLVVGRGWEMAAVEGVLDRAMSGCGGVVAVVGAPGVGKTRMAREAAALANARGVEVFSTFCESHASSVPFHVVSRLLREATGISRLHDGAARAQIRAGWPDADPDDLLLFDDLLGIADPGVGLPVIDPDARRRRLTALVNAAALARETPAVYVVEDLHWIDEVSESMLADFFTVIPQTGSMVLITHRPEYEGALARVHGAQTIALGPLSDSETGALVGELLGRDPSVAGLAATIVSRVGGNPFFAEEMVRDLAERGVLRGDRGAYVCQIDVTGISVPATLQATIGARIDRLDRKAKRTLWAAAVIGSRFDTELLTVLGVEPVLEELIKAELVDQVRFTGDREYAFHHPLVRAVAYESQLKSDRAELHRRLAAAIQQRDPGSADENAALIAEHLQSAGDLHAAYGWHMRAATWAATRDVAAAYLSWERARQVADALPDDDPNRLSMRIAPRTLLCAHAFRVHVDVSGGLFEELRQLCAEAGDKASPVIGMTGLMREHMRHGRVREASRLATETMALVESIGDPTLTVGLSFSPITIKLQMGEMAEALRWSQTAIDLADGDPTKGNFIIGSPLAVTGALRGIARLALGRPGWRDDLDWALAMAREADPLSHVIATAYTYFSAIPNGVLPADDFVLRDIEETLRITERSSDDFAVGNARLALGVVLVHRNSSAERERGLEVLEQVRDMCLKGRIYRSLLAAVDGFTARERARRGDRDAALPELREAVDDLFLAGQFGFCAAATGALVETLLQRGTEGDVREAEAAVDRLAAAAVDEGFVMGEIWPLRLRALLARSRGDEAGYRELRDRYRDMATSLGFEGHMKWAEEMA